jgi:hypothetical protein
MRLFDATLLPVPWIEIATGNRQAWLRDSCDRFRLFSWIPRLNLLSVLREFAKNGYFRLYCKEILRSGCKVGVR